MRYAKGNWNFTRHCRTYQVNSIRKDAKKYLYPYFILSGLNLIISFLFELIKKGVSVSLFNMTRKWLLGIFWSLVLW